MYAQLRCDEASDDEGGEEDVVDIASEDVVNEEDEEGL